MKVQTETTPLKIFNLVFALPLINLPSTQPIQASSRDYGFDFDEEEIARELHAPLPVGLSTPTIPEVEADEFEACYLWFIS